MLQGKRNECVQDATCRSYVLPMGIAIGLRKTLGQLLKTFQKVDYLETENGARDILVLSSTVVPYSVFYSTIFRDVCTTPESVLPAQASSSFFFKKKELCCQRYVILSSRPSISNKKCVLFRTQMPLSGILRKYLKITELHSQDVG